MRVLGVVVANRVIRRYGDNRRFACSDSPDSMEVNVLQDVVRGARDIADIAFVTLLAHVEKCDGVVRAGGTVQGARHSSEIDTIESSSIGHA
jgi:hypothetical protein